MTTKSLVKILYIYGFLVLTCITCSTAQDYNYVIEYDSGESVTNSSIDNPDDVTTEVSFQTTTVDTESDYNTTSTAQESGKCFAYLKRSSCYYSLCYYCCSPPTKPKRSKYCFCDIVDMDYCRAPHWLKVLRNLPDYNCTWNLQAAYGYY